MNDIINKHRIIYILLLIFSATFAAHAAPPKASAKLSSSAIEMGDKISLDVQVVSDRSAKGRFPIFDGIDAGGFAGVCGDSVELGADYKSGSIDLGSGRIQTDYVIPVQAFDSGFYTIPALAYVSGNDTAYTEPLTLKVVPVAANATDEISDYTDVLPPGEGEFMDIFPLWLLDWWWVVMIVVLALVAILLFLMRYKRVLLLKAAKPLPPYEEALHNLFRLREDQLWQNGVEKEYYTRLVDILRRYISRRFEIHAMEMTSGQILDSVKKHERIKPYLKQFEAVLTVADFAKFANMRCTPEENEGAYDEVLKFVKETQPTVEENKVEAEREKKNAPRQKNARWERRNKPVKKRKGVGK